MLHRIYRAPYICRSCRLHSSRKTRRNVHTSKLLPESPARTRFAPSPTGYLHLGSLRTALYNYLLAKRTGGQFLLRIEDTDKQRTIPDAEKRIYEVLRWAGLNWDEGPEIGGPFGPYRQSERTGIYKAHANQLLDSGHAYRCFCTPDQLRAKADERSRLGLPTEYDRTCYHLQKEESDERAHRGQSFVVRLKDPEKSPKFVDLVFGKQDIHTERRKLPDAFEDPILLKSDGLPTYHLANVVDDHHMKITHVIRGSEWLISTRKHLSLYNAFSWKPPTFAHVGLLLDKDGSKLSKRDKAFDISLLQKDGVLPEALNNFLVLLGWSHRQKSDVMTMRQLESIFDLKFTKGNPTVAMEKLWFLSPKHAADRLQSGSSIDDIIDSVMKLVQKDFLPKADLVLPSLKGKPLPVVREHVSRSLQLDIKNYKCASDFVSSHPYLLLKDPLSNPLLSRPAIAAIGQQPDSEICGLEKIREKVLDVLVSGKNDPWQRDELSQKVAKIIEYFVAETLRHSTGNYDALLIQKAINNWVWQCLRGWIAWVPRGPALLDTMELLGPKVVMHRLRTVKLDFQTEL